MREIKRVAVLGSGVMGATIAAHLANCGIPSIMLDIVPPNLSEEERKNRKLRNSFADKGKAALLKSSPAALYVKSNVDMIETGNFEDDMARVAECDWIIEVVMEKLEIKHQVFAEVAKHRKPGTIVSTNTSGIPIGKIAEVMDAEMRAHFLGTHFFNPPRYLKLLELIPLPDTKPEVMAQMAAFGENILGKGIVYAKDTPNFVANRIITFAMQWLMHEMTKAGLSVEEVDALTGTAIGHASSATFRTADLVGLDTLQKVVGNVRTGCPDDERLDLMQGPDWFDAMVAKGLYGNKSGGGFYKKTDEKDEKGKKIVLGFDPATGEHRAPVKPRFACTGAVRSAETVEEKIRVMHLGDDNGSKFLFSFFANLAQYAGNRIPEIADDIVNIDNACKWGFAWERGIFETWDILGFDAVCERMAAEGVALPPVAEALKAAGGGSFYKLENGKRMYFDAASKSYKPVPVNPRELVLVNVKTDSTRVVQKFDDASLIDLGDGIVCAEFHCKMNAIGPDIIAALNAGVSLLEQDKFEGMILANQGPHFSAGANLMLVLGAAMQAQWDFIENMVHELQGVGMRMKYCPKPVVGAPHHYTFGGGVELNLHTDKVVIAGETYAGLVEVGVGVIPAGGGTKELLVRALENIPANVAADPFPFVRRAFENIATAKVGTSGAEVVELGYFRTTDIVLPNFDHQVQRAKDVCLGLIKAGYTPPKPPRLYALGETSLAAFRAAVWGMQQAGFASEHDMLISEHLARILCGGDRMQGAPMTEQDVLDLECEAFVSLCGTEKTQARIQHMLATGKPLRN
ncbi:MAG TPA: 3-hydroxyacyl-CoA dehydrogenase/enoyl-CoA hydratase family protein [Candidatus Hydrogenedentes bacterium]|nr:3-hydroxyacyl-CoA dehydrogenase/enoyl-CoA hydratase family protein [Candidatus Hydrogenedentota bacterium]